MGDIVLFFTLMMQVVQPLTWLGGMYRYTLRCLTDAGEGMRTRIVLLLSVLVGLREGVGTLVRTATFTLLCPTTCPAMHHQSRPCIAENMIELFDTQPSQPCTFYIVLSDRREHD